MVHSPIDGCSKHVNQSVDYSSVAFLFTFHISLLNVEDINCNIETPNAVWTPDRRVSSIGTEEHVDKETVYTAIKSNQTRPNAGGNLVYSILYDGSTFKQLRFSSVL